MPKKIAMTPQLYANFGTHYKRLRSMKQGQFVQWACHFWQNAYNEGFEEAQQKYTQSGINISDDIDASVYDADTLYSDLLTIRGIGPKRARDIINKITEGNA
jgi:hypothetical protein